MPETTAGPARGDDDGAEIVKWYTRARRFPQLIGKTPDGKSLWGGPYTYAQVVVGVGLVVLGSKTVWLWGQFGRVTNVLILGGVSYGVVLILGRLPFGSRNPLSVAAGIVRAVASPGSGRRGGRPVRLSRPHKARARIVIAPVMPRPGPEPRQTAPDPVETHNGSNPVLAALAGDRHLRRRHSSADASRIAAQPNRTGDASGQVPVSDAPADRASITPAMSHVQRLLASDPHALKD
jgi:hypothetical protein